MPRQLSDAVELLRFEAELEELCMSAFRSWAPEVEAAVLPELEGIVASLVAAGTDLPPMPEGVGDVGPAWKRLLLSKIMPGVEKLVLRRLASRMEKSGAAEAAKTARAELPSDPLLTTIYGGRKSRDARTVYQLPSQRQWQADYLTDVENRMSNTPDTVFRSITAEVAAGTSKGESIPKLRDRVHTLLRGNNMAMWRGRATTIARTEAVGAFNGATLRAAIAQQVLLGVELEKAWVATIDGRTRKTHFAADGQRRPLDGKFKVGRANLDRPGDPRGPAEEVINCVVGSTQVGWAGQDVTHATRRSYRGSVLNLRTADGHQLSITPNHPVLTRSGYIPAGLLQPGDYLVTSGPAPSPYVDDGPPRIDEFYRASSIVREPQRVSGGGVHFHGDAAKGEGVDVVRTDSSLRDGRYARAPHSFEEFDLVRLHDRARGLTAGSAGQGRTGAVSAVTPVGLGAGAASGVVRGAGSGSTLLDGEALSGDSVGFGGGSDTQAVLLQAANDCRAADPEAATHLRHAHALGMKFSQLIHIDRTLGDHDVYNLHTTENYYTANNIAVHNCRCTIIEVEPGDALPGETDRQTERGPGDATVRNRTGSRQDEIDRRAADGVIRARDDDGGDGIVAAATGGEPMEREWTGVLAPLGKPTGDGRMFDENMAVAFRDFPLPLMWQQQTSDFPHSQAYTVGSIREATVEGGVIKASGILFATPEADEAEAQLKEGVTRPSVDLCDDTWELRDGDGNLIDPEAMWDMTEEELADVVMCFTAATVMGATLVAKPAFAEAKIEVGGEVDEDEDEDATEDEDTDEDTDADKPEETEDTDAEPEETDDEDKTKAAVGSSTVAAPSVTEAEQALLAAAPLRPQFDVGLFGDPGLTEPTRLQYDPKTGRVWGHVATWGVCHLGVRDKCIMAPTSAQQYAQFHTHEVDTADGPLAVGVLSYGSGHANPRAGLSVALEHYDNAATAWAFVRAGEDATGVWVSGVVSPFADPEQVSMALTAPLSGDWRRVGGSLELCAALSVNTPGFHPGGAHDEQGRPLSLVAAGVVPVEKREASAAFRSMVSAAVREELGRQQRHAALTASAGARGLLPTPVPSDDDRARRARALSLKMGRR